MSKFIQYKKLGILEDNRNQPTKAIKWFSKALDIKPNDHVTLQNRGNVYTKVGNYKKAMSDYNKAIEHNDNCTLKRCGLAFDARGSLKLELGDYIGGIDDLLSAIGNDPFLASRYLIASRKTSVAYKKRFKAALRILNLHISKQPDDAKCYAQRSVVYLNLNDVEHAIEDGLKVISLNPDTETWHLCLGVYYLLAGEYSEAIKFIRKSLKVYPEKAVATMCLGVAYQEKKSYATAIKHLTSAIEMNPDYLTAYKERYECFIKQGKNELAKKDEIIIKRLLAA